MNIIQLPIEFNMYSLSEVCCFQKNIFKASSKRSHFKLSATQMIAAASRWQTDAFSVDKHTARLITLKQSHSLTIRETLPDLEQLSAG